MNEEKPSFIPTPPQTDNDAFIGFINYASAILSSTQENENQNVAERATKYLEDVFKSIELNNYPGYLPTAGEMVQVFTVLLYQRFVGDISQLTTTPKKLETRIPENN